VLKCALVLIVSYVIIQKKGGFTMSSPAFINKFYKTFSGTDTIAFMILPGSKPITLGTVTTLSYSMYRIKKPVLNIGKTNISGVTRGSRIYGGTMIFTLINQHWLRNLCEEVEWLKSYDNLKCDELPVFDIMITSANEYGSYINMYISGIDFTDEQQTMSVEDMFTENVFQFIARDISTFAAGPVLMTDNVGQLTSNYQSGFFVTDSSVETKEEIIQGFNEYVKKRKEKQENARKKPKGLERELYYSDVN
jgi:hypothetical protein